MDNFKPIPKENPVYLYKIVKSDGKNSSIVSYKDFIVVKAWSSAGNKALNSDNRWFDYYYNGRIYRKLEVALTSLVPIFTSTSWNMWMYIRDDKLALKMCRDWITSHIIDARHNLHVKAKKYLNDLEFSSNLKVNPKDGVIDKNEIFVDDETYYSL